MLRYRLVQTILIQNLCVCCSDEEPVHVFHARHLPQVLYTVFATDVSQYLFYLLLGVLCATLSVPKTVSS